MIYTDGACSGNPGPGGWAWATAPTGEPSDTGGEAHTTNQRMEIMAAMEALRSHVDHEGPIEIRSDSTYVVHCFRDSWHVGWKAPKQLELVFSSVMADDGRTCLAFDYNYTEPL